MTGIRKINLGFYIAFKLTKEGKKGLPRSRIPSAIDAFFLLRKQAGDLLKTLK